MADATQQGSGDSVRELEEAGRALEAFARTGALLRDEIERLARTGEADLDRLIRKLAETLAAMAAQQIAGGLSSGAAAPARGTLNLSLDLAGMAQGAGSAVSPNQAAAMLARAVRRGARFT